MKKNIALVQFAVTVGDVAANYTRVEQLLTEAVASHPDIIVLPETWNTGFAPTPALKDMADPATFYPTLPKNMP
ncbi:nitrilase-related carbon-nitrogen hydrolase [uncultured Veillonella sp.]|uniref:nitrilase-related carbon-nitrogen hydrolase n=1 Tax=uncultured Veillonella sp. TaxID=159268 RepID=UPI002590FAAE|nr:nitrilase-related carbon-nitrogen hydrolase [uncultured Veillonella sp.]